MVTPARAKPKHKLVRDSFRRFLENLYWHDEPPLALAIAWEAFAAQGHSIASFCAWDGQEFLAKIAGALAIVPLNILSADIYTRGDNVVLDVFRVCDTRFRAVPSFAKKAHWSGRILLS